MAEGHCSKKRNCTELSGDVEMETISVPKDLIEPLKLLIAKLCSQINPNETQISLGEIKHFDQTNDIDNKKLTLAEFRQLKSKLHNNLKGFDREEVYANLEQRDYEKFKDVRKTLSRWFRLGNACTQRTENPYSYSHRLIKCSVDVSQSVRDRENTQSIKRFFEDKRSEVESVFEYKLLDELHGISNGLNDEFSAITDRVSKLIWAKAFRAVLANESSNKSKDWGPQHSTPVKEKSVSFADTSNSGNSTRSGRSVKNKSILRKNHMEELSDSSSGSDVDYSYKSHHRSNKYKKSFRQYRGKHSHNW